MAVEIVATAFYSFSCSILKYFT